jgi:hypothetical protein
MHVMKRSLAAAALAAAVLAGCKKEPPPPPPMAEAPIAPEVRGLTLGSAIGADKAVMAAKDTFGVRDTIYVSIATDGTGDNVMLKALWTFGADTVRADSLTLNMSGPAVSEFHISRPRAWPKGAYRVSVTLNDGAPQARDFVVR